MNVMTLPRTVLAFEYSVIRRPVAVIEGLLLGRLDAEDPRRLTVERALGQVDAAAGRWLNAPALTARGERSQAHADAVTKARELHAKAQQTQTAADATLAKETKAADRQRAQAAKDHRDDVNAAARQSTHAKSEATQQAKARAETEKATIAQQAKAKVAAADNRQHTRAAATDNHLKAVTAVPKTELADARETAKDAAARRGDADRLAKLAETEKQSRHNAQQRAAPRRGRV